MLRYICILLISCMVSITTLAKDPTPPTHVVQVEETSTGRKIIYAAEVIGGVVILLAFTKKAYKGITNTVTMASNIKKIVAELSPNGGSSIKDTVNDIKDCQLKSHERIVIADERAKAVLNEADHALFESDKNGNCVWANRTYMTRTGRAFDEVQGMGWINCVDQQDKDRILEEWQSCVAQKCNFEQAYKMVDNRTGDAFNVKCRATVLHNDKNQAIGWVGTIKKL